MNFCQGFTPIPKVTNEKYSSRKGKTKATILYALAACLSQYLLRGYATEIVSLQGNFLGQRSRKR